MKKPSPTSLVVQSSTQITPNMQRIELHGEGLARFPADCEGGYIKLMFTKEGSADLSNLADGERPVMRTYTIRTLDFMTQTMTVDFVRHQVDDCGCGHAARWALNAKPGDTINIAGPGTIQNINSAADWFFMVADMTSLPALSAKLKTLPNNAKGYAVVEVLSKEDIQVLEAPERIEFDWVVADKSESLAVRAKQKAWLDGDVFVWSASEFDTMRELRQYFRNEKDVDRDNIYISSYWKNGVTEEGHKVIKQKDAEGVA
ncbi:NADPH-dependent ferric siderophore reductase [Enterovibrio norvegicus]|uniref:siderophore-interacting protein n=1 Tax=Enterovibrio norvegicus TaxID=188144 RepID=UPI000C81FFB0|nr:siderophore-interacting protein [Enterovibrio norvegicus]MCC4800362.1 siderophore-interacting protein [Enterovibrio norvegicus]PMH62793.1 NADPH-dependent ferric siderophore reductase [Enterovibrio norvegicus]PMI30857.1 NADPH-dependent ferric siderophore reductase [Enterovibrio norvegicus]PMI35193.1 NADPH-dependent ferric siderophore reductase [Enterovibrio norvegicus]PMN51097.1 NADPH-dependent ferric siderophore reductase [Enterovibrio norvegicus]